MLDINEISLAVIEEEISKIQQKGLQEEIKIEEDASCIERIAKYSL